MHHPFYLLVLAVWLITEIWNRFFTPKRGAQKIADQAQKLYSAPHKYVPVKAEDFRDLDLAFYDRMRSELEARGFRYLGDFENVTVSSVFPSMRTFLRRFIGENNTIMASVFHHKTRGMVKPLSNTPYYLDVETEFTDGTFLCTSNTDNTKASPIPGIIAQRHPQPTTTDELLALHREKLAELVSQGLTPRPVTNAAEYEAAQHRQQELKSRHKKAQGFVDIQQVKAIAEGKGILNQCSGLLSELEAIQKRNKATPPPIPTEPRTTVV